MKITAKARRKLATAKKKAGKFLADKKNRKIIFLLIVAGLVILLYSKFGKKETTTTTPKPGSGGKVDTNPGTNPGTVAPFPDYTWTPGSESTPKGTYSTKVAGRLYDSNKTPEFAIQFTASGITDNTPGLTRSGGISRLDGRNVFYAVSDRPVDTTLENFFLPDGPHTVQQYVCNAAVITNFAVFKERFNGWNNGVNTDNARMSHIFLSVYSDVPTENSIAPRWLRASRQMIAPSVGVPKNWVPYGKHLAIGHRNKNEPHAKYIALGAAPYYDISGNQMAGAFWTTMKGNKNPISDGELYGQGAHAMELLGNSPNSYLASEYAENMQENASEEFYTQMSNYYRGARDKKGTKIGNWGDYGGDQFYSFVKPDLAFQASRADYIKSLTTHLYNGWSVHGFSPDVHRFYTANHHKVRGVNIKYYYWNSEYNLALEFAYARNRVSLGTMTYGGENNECLVSNFTCTKTESFVMNGAGQHVAIENATTGEIIPFPNGEIRTKHMQVPVPWDWAFEATIWSMVMMGGTAMWDAPGSELGGDTTKLHHWGDRPVDFRPTGGNWGSWNPGQNGAPASSDDGMMHSLYAAPQDASLAASEILWSLRDRLKVTRWARYTTSNNGGFTPTPGTEGLHMNGGNLPLNRNLFVERDIYEQKKGVAVDCRDDATGKGVVFYQNKNVAPNQSEDNVTVNGHYIGRVYGGQIAYKTYQS